MIKDTNPQLPKLPTIEFIKFLEQTQQPKNWMVNTIIHPQPRIGW